MRDVVDNSKASRMLFRNLILGLSGFAVSLALSLLTLRVQDYLQPGLVNALIFLFPLPIACGLAVGLVSPHKAIIWAPLWSGIFTLLLIALLSSELHNAGAALSPARIAFTFAGIALSALAGLLGQWAVTRGYVGKLILALIVSCCLLGGICYWLLEHQMQVYERVVVPQALLEVDRDYIATQIGAKWTCERQIDTGSYLLSSRLYKWPVRVLVAADGPMLRYVEYENPGGHAHLLTKGSARAYLKRLGVRDACLVGLTPVTGSSERWQSILKNTRLTVWRDGRIRFEAIAQARSLD